MNIEPIESFQKKKEYLICIDSDGTAMDSMTIKHIKCFGPCMVREWGLEAYEKEVLRIWNDVNLYSPTRGINRFLGLSAVMKKVKEDVKTQQLTQQMIEEIDEWIRTTESLSNRSLIQSILQTGNDTLVKVLRWSERVNMDISELTWEEHQPFEGVREFFEKYMDQVDYAIISSANKSTLCEEWEYYDLTKYIGVMTSQENGTKEVCIQRLLEKGYDPKKVMMIGDAIPDYEAARSNHIYYCPILAGNEVESWKKVTENYGEIFLSGQMEQVQEKLNGEFMNNLHRNVHKNQSSTYYCNPINIEYKYQFNRNMRKNNAIEIAREAADPSMIEYHGTYYLFASMSLGVYASQNLVEWDYYSLPKELPLYDYAPDVRIINDYVYFSASKKGEICDFYRTKNIVNGPYEKIEGSFDFWDPHLYQDEDQRVYFYWGCSNVEPLWGVELDPVTMRPLGDKIPLIYGDVFEKGFEKVGENHSKATLQGEALEIAYQEFFRMQGNTEESVPRHLRPLIKGMLSNEPYIEGAWMNKINGRYYLQYACNGTQYNVYADGVYVSDHPLGPYRLAKNNPFSYKPGGFIPGAGHGSTIEDKAGRLWHTATMRISINHDFERRLGIWPAGVDEAGELFCNQRYGDWPMKLESIQKDPWAEPEWYLLSYGKNVTASSYVSGCEPNRVTNENVQNWWKADGTQSGEWLILDLEESQKVHCIQINFADDQLPIEVPGEIRGTTQARYIEEANQVTQWLLEYSCDGITYEILQDKRNALTNLPHDLVIVEEGIELRYIRLTIQKIPYAVAPCISGLRVFGIGKGNKPLSPVYEAQKIGEVGMVITVDDVKETLLLEHPSVVGYTILWGHAPDCLYHSVTTFDKRTEIHALVRGESYYVRVDAFNEAGITKGEKLICL